MTREEFERQLAELAARHGGMLSSYATNPEIAEMEGGERVGTIPNPTPVYRYIFGDGSYLDARGTGGKGSYADTFEIRGGTALKPETTAADQYSVRRDLAGQEEIGPTGIPVGYWRRDGTFHNYSETEVKQRLAQLRDEGKLPSGLNPQTLSPAGVGTTGSSRLRFPEETALDEAQADYYRAQTAKMNRDLEPKFARAMQDYFDSIDKIQGMIESGQMKPEEADGYMTLFRQNLDAGLRGTTPFEQEKFKVQEERQRADIGKELLNQRLSSGASMTNTLLQGLFQNLGTLGWGLEGGQTVPFDPFALAQNQATNLQGGPEIGELGKALLGQLAPSGGTAQPTSGPVPQGPGGGLPLNVTLALEMADAADRRQSAMQPAMAGGVSNG